MANDTDGNEHMGCTETKHCDRQICTQVFLQDMNEIICLFGHVEYTEDSDSDCTKCYTSGHRHWLNLETVAVRLERKTLQWCYTAYETCSWEMTCVCVSGFTWVFYVLKSLGELYWSL